MMENSDKNALSKPTGGGESPHMGKQFCVSPLHASKRKMWPDLLQSLRTAGVCLLIMFGFSKPVHSLSPSRSHSSVIVLQKVRGTAGFCAQEWNFWKVSPHEYTQTVTLELIRRLFILRKGNIYTNKHTQTHKNTDTHTEMRRQWRKTKRRCLLLSLLRVTPADTQSLSPCVNTRQKRRFRSVSFQCSRAANVTPFWCHSQWHRADLAAQ